MYGCVVQNNEGAVIRIGNDEPNTVQLYLKNKSDELNYAGRQLFIGSMGRFKPPFIID